jgi:3-oxoacyl-(acyl-carrier-protein) synthase
LKNNSLKSQDSLLRHEKDESRDRIAVSGLGCCSAAGPDVPSVRKNITRAHCRIDRTDLFSPCPVAPVFAVEKVDVSDGLRQVLGRELDRRYLAALNRTTVLAVTAIAEALRHAAIRPEDLQRQKVGIALGTTVGCSFLNEEYYRNWKEGRTQNDGPIFDYLSTNLAEQVQRILQVTGPRAVITNACASGTDAIGLALGWLRHGLCDIAIAGGADGLSRVACHGFSSLMLASKNPCRPFDAGRDGLNLGEGAGVLIMEREASALVRQAPIPGWVLGYGSASDAHHPTAPHPEGRGLQAAILQAVHDAGITTADIGFINAHGTGTPANDRAELTALAHLGFADRPDCPVVSTKGATGHTLGAAGGIEAVLTLCTLNSGTTFGSTGCISRDTALPLVVPTAGEQCQLTGRIGMSESLAFGGGNSAIILEGSGS